MQKKISIQNKRAKFEYKFIEEYTAGIVLTGTEIKSLRNSKASISESFCEFNQNGELFTVNMQIEEYRFGTRFNHRPKAQRKLLLNKKELKKLHKEVKINGLTIVPIRLYSKNGIIKIEIALAKGKKLYDKRQDQKNKDWKRQKDRLSKIS